MSINSARLQFFRHTHTSVTPAYRMSSLPHACRLRTALLMTLSPTSADHSSPRTVERVDVLLTSLFLVSASSAPLQEPPTHHEPPLQGAASPADVLVLRSGRRPRTSRGCPLLRLPSPHLASWPPHHTDRESPRRSSGRRMFWETFWSI